MGASGATIERPLKGTIGRYSGANFCPTPVYRLHHPEDVTGTASVRNYAFTAS